MVASGATGLARLGILHKTTLPYSPYQNGKQENFWAQLEGRLMAMLEGVQDLTLPVLNEATQAWVEMEYQRRVHSETGQTPLQRYLDGPTVGRPCPESDALRLAFTTEERRTQRRAARLAAARATLRDPGLLSIPDPASAPLRRLGPHPRLPHRRTHRDRSLSAFPPRSNP
jgi:hypothetical protein